MQEINPSTVFSEDLTRQTADRGLVSDKFLSRQRAAGSRVWLGHKETRKEGREEMEN